MNPSPRPRRAGRPQPGTGTTREQILEAATDLFSRLGYPGVSIRDITRRVGIKESSLYNHFAGKEALLGAIMDRMEAGFRARVVPEEVIAARIRAQGPERFMRGALREFAGFWNEPANIRLWLVVSMEQYRNPRAGHLVLEEMARVRSMSALAFRTMRELRMIRPLDPALLADAYSAALRAMLSEYSIHLSIGEDTRAVRRRMSSLITFFTGIIVRPTRQEEHP